MKKTNFIIFGIIVILSLGNILIGCDNGTTPPVTHTVSFMDGETVLRTETVENGTSLSQFSSYVPEKNGYDFEGWFSDIDLTTEFNFNTVVTGNISIFSKWEKLFDNPVTVTFMDGITVLKKETVEEGTNILSLKYTPEKTGYEFKGWFSDIGLTIEFDFDIELMEDITVYSKWDIKTYTVNFVDNVHGNTTSPIQVNHGDTIPTGQIPTWTHVDYDFDGWDNNVELPITSNMTFTSVWTRLWTVTFSGVGVETFTETVRNGDTVTKPENPTRTHNDPENYRWSFNGWLLNGDEYDFTEPVTENITLVADWEERELSQGMFWWGNFISDTGNHFLGLSSGEDYFDPEMVFNLQELIDTREINRLIGKNDEWGYPGISEIKGRSEAIKESTLITYTNVLGFPFFISPKEFGEVVILNAISVPVTHTFTRHEANIDGVDYYIYNLTNPQTASMSTNFTMEFPN
jgi:uncharacterized repeat protein (TIGR02543 family)